MSGEFNEIAIIENPIVVEQYSNYNSQTEQYETIVNISSHVYIEPENSDYPYFKVSNRLSELETQQDKDAAISNLGLSVIDGGEFFTAAP